MITDENRKALSDLILRALDTIDSDYGDEAELTAASLVFEIRTRDEDGDIVYHGNYKSLETNSPHHIAGLLRTTADWLQTPDFGSKE